MHREYNMKKNITINCTNAVLLTTLIILLKEIFVLLDKLCINKK